MYLKLKHQFVGSLLLSCSWNFLRGLFKSLSISTMQFVIDFTPLLTFAHTQYMPWWQLVIYQVPICLGFGKFRGFWGKSNPLKIDPQTIEVLKIESVNYRSVESRLYLESRLCSTIINQININYHLIPI